MSDAISREGTSCWLEAMGYPKLAKAVMNEKRFPSAVPPAQQNLSEEYAKAVRNWLVNYQIKCAELKGRYTPYEVLGWIVSDWRKENGIW